MATDKACIQKRKLPPHSSQQEPFAQGDRARRLWTGKTWHRLFVAPFVFSTAAVHYKTGQLWARWCRVAWLWCKSSLGCFYSALLLICSLSLSPRLTTPSEQTHCALDFAILVSPHTKHLGILIDYYSVSFIVTHSYMKDRGSQDQGKGWERKERRVSVVKPKMAACSSKGGETETLNIGELFFLLYTEPSITRKRDRQRDSERKKRKWRTKHKGAIKQE